MGLKQKTVHGFIWTSAGTLGNGILSIVVTMILARTLLPYDFALVELLIIFIALSNVVVDSGFSQAIIRDDNPTDKDLSSVFFLNIGLSSIIYIALFFAAPFISRYFNAPELTLLSRIVFLVVIFNSLSIIQNATLSRNLNFAAVNKSSVIGSLLAGLTSITMALSGCGIWALVANMVLLPFFRSILLWFHSEWRPSRAFSFKSIKKYFNFSVFLLMLGLIDAITTNIISLFIGKVYTKNDLGFFSQGRRFDGYIVTPFSSIIRKVTYPILSKIKNDDARLKDGYRQIIGVVMFVFIPLMFLIIASSDNMIQSLLGEKWVEAGIYLKIFAIGGLFMPLQSICANIAYVKGKTNIVFNLSVITQVVRVILILTFIKQGVLALTISFVVSGIIGSLLYITLGMKLLNYSIKELIYDTYFILFVSIISVFFVLLIGYYLSNLNVMVLFSFQVITMFVLYTIIMKYTNNKYYPEIKTQIISLMHKFKTR